MAAAEAGRTMAAAKTASQPADVTSTKVTIVIRHPRHLGWSSPSVRVSSGDKLWCLHTSKLPGDRSVQTNGHQ